MVVLGVLIGVGMAIGGLVSGVAASHRAPHETATATGMVTTAGKCAGRATSYGRAVFTAGGSPYTATVACNTHKGERVAVKYNPADPAHNNDRENSVHHFVIAGIGALLALVVAGRAAPALLRERRRSMSGKRRSPRHGRA
ncbi:hypothetical protein EFY87_06665 [Flexivirga caeni]|uniref:DUF3592 domain-containing protein n=1 Tax=Flexivirga caeni TaxID=2294115 RepID=A0A3M9MEE0_9MICO|nr:hypothetical protein EFY87_06665 [Flexivirga caeni]